MAHRNSKNKKTGDN